jgi:hypothetical protein
MITQIGDMDQKVMLRSMEAWMTKVAPLVEKALRDDPVVDVQPTVNMIASA